MTFPKKLRLIAWAANGWRWVVGFKVHRENIDAFLRPRATSHNQP